MISKTLNKINYKQPYSEIGSMRLKVAVHKREKKNNLEAYIKVKDIRDDEFYLKKKKREINF